MQRDLKSTHYRIDTHIRVVTKRLHLITDCASLLPLFYSKKRSVRAQTSKLFSLGGKLPRQQQCSEEKRTNFLTYATLHVRAHERVKNLAFDEAIKRRTRCERVEKRDFRSVSLSLSLSLYISLFPPARPQEVRTLRSRALFSRSIEKVSARFSWLSFDAKGGILYSQCGATANIFIGRVAGELRMRLQYGAFL